MEARNIDEVVELLDGVIADAKARGSRFGYFAALYRQVTLRVRQGIQQGFFEDGPRMDRLDACFASRYLTALEAWQSGGELTRSWKVAFTAMSDPGQIILQDLLVGMNAHINLDLGIAAAETAPGESIEGLKADFFRINQILAALIKPIEGAIDRFSPLLDLLERVGGKGAAEALNFSMDAARDDAWRHAVLLAHMPELVRDMSIEAIDGKVSFLGRLIAHPIGLVGKAVELIKMEESNDVVAITDALNGVVALPAPATPPAPIPPAPSPGTPTS